MHRCAVCRDSHSPQIIPLGFFVKREILRLPHKAATKTGDKNPRVMGAGRAVLACKHAGRFGRRRRVVRARGLFFLALSFSHYPRGFSLPKLSLPPSLPPSLPHVHLKYPFLSLPSVLFLRRTQFPCISAGFFTRSIFFLFCRRRRLSGYSAGPCR